MLNIMFSITARLSKELVDYNSRSREDNIKEC